MTSEGPNSRIRRSRVNLSTSLEELLDTVASTGAGTELPRSHTEQSPVSGDLARDAPVQLKKRRADATSESDPLPAKRARWTRADAPTGGARLQARHLSPNSEGPRSALSAPVHKPQAGTESIPSPSKRAGLPWTNTLQSGVEHEEVEEPAKTVQQPNHPKRPYTSALKPEAEEQEQVAPATRSQKRQIGSDGGHDEPVIKRARLTRKNLSFFDKMGKKKVADSTDESGSTKTISTTSSGFDIQARDNGILLPLNSKIPTNHRARRERGARSRGTASPTETEHRGFVKRITGAGNEATIVHEVSRHMLKEYDDEGYKKTFNRAFTAFPKDVGFNNGLSAPQPDLVEGLEAEEFRPFPVGNHIAGAVLYKDDRYSLALPHLAGEWKGPDGSMRTAELQSAYDGAALVYARNQALSYLGKYDPPDHAEITTFTTDGTNLNFYSHHVAQTEDKTLEYHQYPDASYNLTKFEDYKDGRRHLRNTQDDARDQSYALRDQLKERYKQQCSTLPSIAQGTPLPTPVLEPTDAYEETTQYGGEAGYEIIEQPCQATPAASAKHRASHSHSSRSSHHSSSDSYKRKASSSQTSSHGSPGHASKHRSYWKKDPKTGNYYHRHSDGTISWLDDDDDGR